MDQKEDKNQYKTDNREDVKIGNVTKFLDIIGSVRTVDTAPSVIPKKISDQIILYVSGGTKRLYVADLYNNTWYYVSLT